ncbi:MAG: YcjF family protein [Methylococcus sp.]
MTTLTPESSPTVTELMAAERRTAADSLIKNYVLAATGLGFLPFPLVDLGGLMAIQVKLVHGLAKHYGLPFKENVGKSLVTSLIAGASGVVGVLGLASLAKLVPGLGTLAGGASVSLTSGALTYAVGHVFAKHFETGGTLLDFDPKKMQEAFKRKVHEGRRAVAQMVDAPAAEAAPTQNVSAEEGGQAAPAAG